MFPRSARRSGSERRVQCGACTEPMVCGANAHAEDIVIGGDGGFFLNDVWALSLANPAWTTLTPSGTPPHGRMSHSAVYDAIRDRMIVFGGYSSAGFGEMPQSAEVLDDLGGSRRRSRARSFQARRTYQNP